MAAVATEDKVTKAEQEPVDASSEKTGGLDGTKEATVNHNVTPTDEEEVAVDKSEASEVVRLLPRGCFRNLDRRSYSALTWEQALIGSKQKHQSLFLTRACS